MNIVETPSEAAVPASPIPAILAVLLDPEANQVFQFFRKTWSTKLGPKRSKHEIAYAGNRIAKVDRIVDYAIRPGQRYENGSSLPEANLHKALILSDWETEGDENRLRAFHARMFELLQKKAFRSIAGRVEAAFRNSNGVEPPRNFGEMCTVLAAYICSVGIHPDIVSPSAFRVVMGLYCHGNILFRIDDTMVHNLVLAE